MPYERSPTIGTEPGTRTLEELKRYSPPGAAVLRTHTVGRRPDGRLESLADIAIYAGKDFWRYIDFIFPGCNKTPECVNWYLNYRYNCPATEDGKNRRFRGGEKLPLPTLDSRDAKPLDPPKAPPRVGFYDRQAAARYARRWALGINPEYPSYHNDCTRFVSQALLAGGWTMIGGTEWDYNNDDVWWYGKVGSKDYDNPINNIVDGIKDNLGYDRPADQAEIYRASQTWSGAPAMARFLKRSRRGFQRSSFLELEAGDVIQEYDGDKGRMAHTMIVTQRLGDEIEYAQHTDGAIRLFKKRFPTGNHAKYPKSYFVFWKINDRLQ
jgi:hypothetical protein